MMNRLACLAICGLLLVAAPAHAHRVGVPVTTIAQNPVSKTWEVTHRLSAHDFEPQFQGQISPSRLYDTPEGIALIGEYAAGHFKIGGLSKATYIGAELDGEFVYIYFEFTPKSDAILIDNDLLFETRNSTALVNIETGAGVKSLMFTIADGAKPVSLSGKP